MDESKTPRGPAAFGGHSRGSGPFSAGFRNTIEDPRSKAAKVTCFTVHFGTGFRGGPDPATLSGIRPCRALWPANGATRRKSRRENTVLSDRRLRRSRARGAVRFRTRHASRGSGASARGLCVNLRDIGDVRFWICQHYRRSEGPDRVMHVKLRKIRNASVGLGGGGALGVGQADFYTKRERF